MLISPPEFDIRYLVGRVIAYWDHHDMLCCGRVTGLHPTPGSTDPDPVSLIEVESESGYRHCITDGQFYGILVEEDDHAH
jgi:hypothetical protein